MICCSACGTQVETGNNLSKSALTADSGDAQAANRDGTTGPAGSTGAAGAGGSGGGSSGSGGGGSSSGGGGTSSGGGGSGAAGSGEALTCFGPDPALNADFQAFCANIDPTMKTTFATAYAQLCTQDRLWNLMLDPCSWQGTGTSATYRRVLTMTALTDQTTQTFSYLAAYGSTSELPLENAITLIMAELADPTAYAQRYVTIQNSRVYDITPDGDGYDYSVDFASSAATVSFRATLKSQKITDNLTAVYDYGIGDYVLMQLHHYLRLMLRDGAKTRMIVIDEKTLADGGNHAVAYQNLMSVLQQFQERDYVNSTR